jgi:hypothetical protein
MRVDNNFLSDLNGLAVDLKRAGMSAQLNMVNHTINIIRPLAAGTHVLIEANLPRQIYNEPFQQGMREHTHFNGGKSWNDSKFPSMFATSQKQE